MILCNVYNLYRYTNMVDYQQYIPTLEKIFMKYSRIAMRLESINDFDFYKKRFLNMHAFLSFC
jgi:hypothetical protein